MFKYFIFTSTYIKYFVIVCHKYDNISRGRGERGEVKGKGKERVDRNVQKGM